jgi:hypothetical protein
VDESKVGMGILVHHSSPDAIEMANGVATVTYQKSVGSHTYNANMVTQKGAVSVTNPDGTATPEIVHVNKPFQTPFVSVRQWSSLVPLGASVLEWDSEYKTFTGFFSLVAKAFETYYPAKQSYILDFEYKKVSPGKLLVKQVREIPSNLSKIESTYLINQPADWCVFQGEFGDVFANHRLKARFRFATKNFKLIRSNLEESIFAPISMTYADGDQIRTINGSPSSFPQFAHSLGTPDDSFSTPVTDRWRMQLTNRPQTVRLTATLRTSTRSGQSPIIGLGDARVEFSANYDSAVPTIEFGPQIASVTNETVLLTPCTTTNASSILVTRTVPASKGAAVTTSFFWPEPPKGATAGYTAPLLQWKESRIEGLTSEPIVLRNYFSQTYRPEHHNFNENFLFEPALEPGISTTILNELKAKNIRYIYVFWGGPDDESYIYAGDENWNLRRLAPKGGG